MRIETQILQRFLRTGDEASERSESFGERAIDEWNAIFHTKLLSRAATMFTTSQHGVGFVNEDTRAVTLCDCK